MVLQLPIFLCCEVWRPKPANVNVTGVFTEAYKGCPCTYKVVLEGRYVSDGDNKSNAHCSIGFT